MQRGFSLVELSIVLVILGLLTGGILAGQSLIRASELRSVSTEYGKYVTAIQTFRDKYFSIPGDFKDATRFWGRQSATADCVTNSSASANPSGACDGNASGQINIAASASQASEELQSWRHLALAGLIEGTYTGIAGAGAAADHVIGTNAPRSKLSQAGWAIRTGGDPYAGDANAYAVGYGNMFDFGGQMATTYPMMPVLKPEEAWNIDTKMDDGKPAQGKVIARYWNNACAQADDGSPAANDLIASYRLSDSSLLCSFHFVRAF